MNHTTQTKQARHTPGPWIEEIGFIMAAQGVYICDPHCKDGPEDHAERDANARLIAAAPDLLAALEELIGSIESDPKHIRCSIQEVNEARKAAIDKANSALSKARGEK